MRNRRFRFMFWDADGGGGSAPPAAPAPQLPDTALTGPDGPEPPTDPPADPPDAPKLPDTALTGDDPAEGDKPKEDGQGEAQADAKPEKPEGYDLTFDEGVQVDADLLGQFQKTAHEMGLTKGQAQKVADLYAGHMAGMTQKHQEAQFQALNDYINNQNAELEKRPDYQAERGLAKKALAEFGSEELTGILAQTALGSHPAMFDFVVKVGRALGEPGIKGGAGRSAEVPLYKQIWGEDGLGPQK